MLDFLLWNKIARIIAQLADTLHISTDRALQIFYDSDVCRMLHDKDLGLLTSSSCHPKFFIKEFSDFLMPCHQHGLGVNLLVQR